MAQGSDHRAARQRSASGAGTAAYSSNVRMGDGLGGALAVAAVAVLGGCWSTEPEPESTVTTAPATIATHGPRLPALCDDLMSTLVPARVLQVRLPPARSYSLIPPDPVAGLRAGLRCEHGVDASGAVLVVTGREYQSSARARAATGPPPAASQPVQVGELTGAVYDWPASTFLQVVDGEVVLTATLRNGVVEDTAAPAALRDIAEAMVARLPDDPA